MDVSSRFEHIPHIYNVILPTLNKIFENSYDTKYFISGIPLIMMRELAPELSDDNIKARYSKYRSIYEQTRALADDKNFIMTNDKMLEWLWKFTDNEIWTYCCYYFHESVNRSISPDVNLVFRYRDVEKTITCKGSKLYKVSKLYRSDTTVTEIVIELPFSDEMCDVLHENISKKYPQKLMNDMSVEDAEKLFTVYEFLGITLTN